MKNHTGWSATIPILTVIVAFILGAARGPFYILGNVDPAYQYLFSSLSILDFSAPRHTDHPGTTLQMLGAGVVFIKWLWANLHSTAGGLEEHVLRHAESYIKAINHVLIILLCAAMFMAGGRLYRHTQNWLSVLVLQLTPFFFVETLIAFYNLSPEPMLMAVVYFLIFFLTPLVLPLQPMETAKPKQAMLLGLLLGFGMATKVTFFPMLLMALLFERWKDRFITAGACLLGFIICTIPILKRYKFMVKWNLTVLEHSGQYGSGSSGLPSISEWIANTEMLFSLAPMLFIFFGIYLAAYLHLRFYHPVNTTLKARVQHFLGISIIAIALQLLVTIKHPGDRYLLPSMIFSGFVSGVVLYYYQVQVWTKNVISYSPRAIFTGVTAVIMLTSFSTWQHMKEMRENKKAARAIVQLTHDRHCLPMSAYISVYKDFAYWFADNWNANRLSKTLHGLEPTALFYEPTNDTFSDFSGPITRQEVQAILDSGRCIYLQTTRQDIFDKQLVLQNVKRDGAAQGLPLYELKGFINEDKAKRPA